MKHHKCITKFKTLFKIVYISGTTAQRTDFIFWIVPTLLRGFYGKCGFNSVPSKKALGLSFSSQDNVFQNKKPTQGKSLSSGRNANYFETTTPPPSLLFTV